MPFIRWAERILHKFKVNISFSGNRMGFGVRLFKRIDNCLPSADAADARKLILIGKHYLYRSLWPCGLRRGSVAARWMGLRVRIPPEAWMPVSCECCVLSSRILYVQRSPTGIAVSKLDREASIMMRPSPTTGILSRSLIPVICPVNLHNKYTLQRNIKRTKIKSNKNFPSI